MTQEAGFKPQPVEERYIGRMWWLWINGTVMELLEVGEFIYIAIIQKRYKYWFQGVDENVACYSILYGYLQQAWEKPIGSGRLPLFPHSKMLWNSVTNFTGCIYRSS